LHFNYNFHSSSLNKHLNQGTLTEGERLSVQLASSLLYLDGVMTLSIMGLFVTLTIRTFSIMDLIATLGINGSTISLMSVILLCCRSFSPSIYAMHKVKIVK